MNVHGSQVLEAPRARVFEAICDPNVLLAVIPGCREIEQVSDTEYRGLIALRLPGIAGTWRTVVRLVDAEPPGYGRLEGDVEGSLGSIRGDATFRLTDRGTGTAIDYDGRAAIDGPLARLDSRFVEGIAGSLIAQGLRDLDARLRGGPPAGAAGDTGRPITEIPA